MLRSLPDGFSDQVRPDVVQEIHIKMADAFAVVKEL